MNEWLSDAFGALAESAGVDAGAITLSEEDANAILGIARIASHDSGDRTNAPLLCYLIGRLLERSPAVTLDQLHADIASRARDQS